MSADSRNNTEKQRDKILEKYGLRYTGPDDLSDVASDMAADAKILKDLAKTLSGAEDDDSDDDDDRDDDRGDRGDREDRDR